MSSMPVRSSCRMNAERYRAVGAHKIWHDIGERELGKMEAMAGKKRVALVDQVENRTDDQRHPQGALWHTF